MKKLFVCVVFYIAGAFITAHADSLTLINHYGKPLNFQIEQGQDLEVGLDSNFSLNDDTHAFASQINSVKNDPDACEPENSPILIYFYDPSTQQKEPNDGYFGVGRKCGSDEKNMDVRPYVGRNINYSVDRTDPQNMVVTFCQPLTYAQQGGVCQ